MKSQVKTYVSVADLRHVLLHKTCHTSSAVQSQKAVSACCTSKLVLSVGLTEQRSVNNNKKRRRITEVL